MKYIADYNIPIEQAISEGILHEIGKNIYEISYRDNIFHFERQLNGWKVTTPRNNDILRISNIKYLSHTLIEANMIFFE